MASSQEFQKLLWDSKQVVYLDCAVSGGPGGARKGLLTAFIGGDEGAVDSCTDVISTFAQKRVYLGRAGAGHATKAVNNMLLATQNWAVSERGDEMCVCMYV